jgi:hypothetical protein
MQDHTAIKPRQHLNANSHLPYFSLANQVRLIVEGLAESGIADEPVVHHRQGPPPTNNSSASPDGLAPGFGSDSGSVSGPGRSTSAPGGAADVDAQDHPGRTHGTVSSLAAYSVSPHEVWMAYRLALWRKRVILFPY